MPFGDQESIDSAEADFDSLKKKHLEAVKDLQAFARKHLRTIGHKRISKVILEVEVLPFEK